MKQINLTDGVRIHSNYKNFLYKVDLSFLTREDAGNQYLLFNPSIHYWIALDEVGASIYQELLSNTSLDETKKNLMQRFSIDAETFNQDAIPFIEELIEGGFFSLDQSPSQAEWMEAKIEMATPARYCFNSIYISLSDDCNLNCLYCFNKKKRQSRLTDRDNNVHPPLTREKIEELLSQFKELSGKSVVFTGGEPTLNQDLLSLCEYARSCGLEPHFITNGTLLKNLDLKRLVQSLFCSTLSRVSRLMPKESTL